MKAHRHTRKPLSIDELELHKASLTENQFRVLRGLIVSGDCTGARAGLNKLLRRCRKSRQVERRE
ncbi:MAG: hypothetical protein KBS59_00280 [Clostridiales bacterium]|nr:hypothetical protein [Clostridiales bacterium]